MRISAFGLIVLFAISFSSCEKDDPGSNSATINWKIKAGEQDLDYNTNYTVNGFTIRYTLVKFYISQPTLKKENGDSVRFPDTYFLVQVDSANQFILSDNIGTDTYSGFEFGYGVDSTRNDENGSLAIPGFDYPIDHPLNPVNQMYWSWNPGYIWMKLEGKIDLNMNGSFAEAGETFSIHTGLTSSYRTLNFDFPQNKSGNLNITITGDMLRFFDNYDLTGDKRNVHPVTVMSPEAHYMEELLSNLGSVFSIQVE